MPTRRNIPRRKKRGEWINQGTKEEGYVLRERDKEQWIKLQGRQKPMGCRVGRERGVATQSAINKEVASILNTTERTKDRAHRGIICSWEIPAFRYDRLAIVHSVIYLFDSSVFVLSPFVSQEQRRLEAKMRLLSRRADWTFPDIRYSRAGLIS